MAHLGAQAVAAQGIAQPGGLFGTGHHRPARLPALALRGQFVDPLVRTEAFDHEAFRMTGHHVQGADADRAGGTKNHQPLRRAGIA